MTVDELRELAGSDPEPPTGLSRELQSLWHTHAGNWDAAHDIAQEIRTPLGSWIHAHLHVIEGDLGNAGYWYRRAGQLARGPDELEQEWRELVALALAPPPEA